MYTYAHKYIFQGRVKCCFLMSFSDVFSIVYPSFLTFPLNYLPPVKVHACLSHVPLPSAYILLFLSLNLLLCLPWFHFYILASEVNIHCILTS